MNNRKCVYLTEGECEEKLVKTLKERPALVVPGKVKKFNVIQNEIPVSVLMSFDPGSLVVLVFDTDKEITEHLKANITRLRKHCARVEVLTIAQVLNFEEELERATDVSKAQDLTKSATVEDFKAAVNRMKSHEFRMALVRHKLDMSKLWAREPPQAFGFITQDAGKVKIGRA